VYYYSDRVLLDYTNKTPVDDEMLALRGTVGHTSISSSCAILCGEEQGQMPHNELDPPHVAETYVHNIEEE
jgi:hypothetical protein